MVMSAVSRLEPDSVETRRLENIANRRWWRRTYPFPHVVAYDIFTDDFYRRLEEAFQQQLAMPNTFNRNMPGYDATAVEFTRDMEEPFAVFVSRTWHDMVANLMNVNCTGDVVGSLHHHEPGSASGRPHNDLNPGWFVDRPKADGVNVADATLCSYRTGVVSRSGIAAHQSVRAIAIMYFLNNPPWMPGDGGETGLYKTPCDPVESPAAIIRPFNNSMVCFECTPFSYHSFITNRRTSRDSVTMWLHRTHADLVARWGEDTLVRW